MRAGRVDGREAGLAARLAVGGEVIEYKSPLSVRKDTYDHSCYRARSDEYCHFMTDSPTARPGTLLLTATPGSLVRVAPLAGGVARVVVSFDGSVVECDVTE